MAIDFSITYIELSWHYWLALATSTLISIFIASNKRSRMSVTPIFYIIVPLLFGVFMYFIFGIVFAILQVK